MENVARTTAHTCRAVLDTVRPSVSVSRVLLILCLILIILSLHRLKPAAPGGTLPLEGGPQCPPFSRHVYFIESGPLSAVRNDPGTLDGGVFLGGGGGADTFEIQV